MFNNSWHKIAPVISNVLYITLFMHIWYKLTRCFNCGSICFLNTWKYLRYMLLCDLHAVVCSVQLSFTMTTHSPIFPVYDPFLHIFLVNVRNPGTNSGKRHVSLIYIMRMSKFIRLWKRWSWNNSYNKVVLTMFQWRWHWHFLYQYCWWYRWRYDDNIFDDKSWRFNKLKLGFTFTGYVDVTLSVPFTKLANLKLLHMYWNTI